MKKYRPIFSTLAFFGMFLIALSLAHSGGSESDLTSDEIAVAQLVNSLRVQHNRAALKVEPLLNEVAKGHSEDMSEKKILDSGPPQYQTPFERALRKRLTDINSAVIVTKASTLERLKDFIQSDRAAKEKFLSPDMTHMGIGIVSTKNHAKWLTIHMVERLITFKNFMLKTRSDVVSRKSITIYGETPKETVKVGMTFGGDLDTSYYDLTKVVTPDLNGDFSVSFDFDRGSGKYGFLFWVYEEGEYRKSNYFDITVQ